MLLVIVLLAVSQATAQTFDPIAYGELTAGEVSPFQEQVTYRMAASAGDVIYMAARPSNPESDLFLTVRLFNQEQTLLAEATDWFGMSLLLPVEIETAGEYIISVGRRADSEDYGQFELLLNTVTLTPASDEIRDTFDNALDFDFYTVAAQAGDLHSFLLSAPQGIIGLVDPTGEFAFVDGVYDDPGTLLYQMTMDGVYQVVVQSVTPGPTPYTLYVPAHDPPRITPGETLDGEIRPGDLQIVAFESAAGKAWDITTTFVPGNASTMYVFYLNDRPYWDTVVYSDFGSGPNGNPRISGFVAPEDGTYYIALVRDLIEAPEPVSLTLAASTLVSLVDGIEQTATLTTETGDLQYRYAGMQGDVIRVQLRQLSETGAPALTILSPDDEILTLASRAMRDMTVELILPVDGSYVFVIQDIAYDRATLDVAIQVDLVE